MCLYTHILTYTLLLLYSFIDGHLGVLHVLAIVNNAAINNGVQIYLWHSDFLSSTYIYPEIELLNNMVVLFFLIFRETSKLFFFFNSGCTNLHSHQQNKSSLFYKCLQHLLCLFLLMIDILTGVR